MTQMNIDEMPAGREIDMLIAEKVMGLNLDKVAREKFASYRRHNAGIGMTGWEEYDKKRYRVRMLQLAVPCYSTDIAAAWEVVEKLGELTNKDVLVEHCADGDRMCTTGRHYRGLWMKDVQAVASTIPLAICRAALKVARSDQHTKSSPNLTTAILSSLLGALQGKLGGSNNE